MSEPLSPDEVVLAIQAAETDEDTIAIERRYVTDTAEEDPGQLQPPGSVIYKGEVTHDDDSGHG